MIDQYGKSGDNLGNGNCVLSGQTADPEIFSEWERGVRRGRACLDVRTWSLRGQPSESSRASHVVAPKPPVMCGEFLIVLHVYMHEVYRSTWLLGLHSLELRSLATQLEVYWKC